VLRLFPDSSTNNALALLPGGAVLRAGGRLLDHSEGEGWSGALAALDTLLSQARPVGAIEVVLSHNFSRVLLLSPPPVRLDGEEMAGWLADCLGRDYGPEAATWHTAWQDAAPGRPVPVAVMDKERHDRLRERIREAGLTTKRMEPWFASAWNRFRRSLARQSGWFALLEPGRIALARVEIGRPVGLRIHQTSGVPAADLKAMIDRESLHCAVSEEGHLWVAAVGVEFPLTGTLAGFRVHGLLPAGSMASGMLS